MRFGCLASSRCSRLAVLLVTAALITGGVSAVLATEARALTRHDVLANAAAYGPSHKYKIGIAVYDTKTRKVYGSGSYRSTFASESVVKAMIATRLILQGRMHGSTARRAYKMITQSDDAIASSFYGSVGGDHLITWIKRHYHVRDLGSPPHRAGWWGNTHITPIGLVKFYAKVKRDRRVRKWLLRAMHHAHEYGSDGTYQFFGLPSATKHAAVKQGWGIDYDDWGRSADFNTTGFVNHDRYAVAILARGPARSYGRAIGNALTRTARRLLPGGRFPDATPAVTYLNHRTGTTNGGQRINLRGHDLTSVQAVYFGATKAPAVRRISATALAVTTPPHQPGIVSLRVATSHGWSSRRTRFTFVAPPVVTSLNPKSGPAGGGTAVTLKGTGFTIVQSVWFGSTAAKSFKVTSQSTITVIAPPGHPGTVPVWVRTGYGDSSKSGALAFTYVGTAPAAPAAKQLAPPSTSTTAAPRPSRPASSVPPGS
jgi:IPT/TIG domain